MRSQIQDANAGAATQVAPSVKHAQRTATIAKHNDNSALQTAANINKAAGTLGEALGEFMSSKKKSKAELEYQTAFHAQGAEEGMSEYAKDLKNTGFTEFIYGGQSPEYLGHLHASARNAATTMFTEEAAFIEGEGADLPPKAYQNYLAQKMRGYVTDNFTEAPDAALAFMQEWKDESNELTKQHVKLYEVREQQKARATVANGWQADLSKYKTLVSINPNKAIQFGQDMYSGKYKPSGMSDVAARQVLVDESINAAMKGDYAALSLLSKSGIRLNEKEQKKYMRAQGVVDADNFNSMEAARLSYEATIESDYSGIPTENRTAAIDNATKLYNSAIQQTSARDTGTSEHIKNIAGSDRWSGVLSNQYKSRLIKEHKAGVARREQIVDYVEEGFEVELANTQPSEKRELMAARLDSLTIAMADPTLDEEVSSQLRNQFIAGKKRLDTWDTALETRQRKEQVAIDKATEEERKLREGVSSLESSGKYVESEPKSKKSHLSGAVSNAITKVAPELGEDLTLTQKLDNLGNPLVLQRFLKASANFRGYLKDSKDIQTAVGNMTSNLRGQLTEGDDFTESQKQNAQALALLKENAPDLYVSTVSGEDRQAIDHLVNAILLGQDAPSTQRKLNELEAAGDIKPTFKTKAEDLLTELGVSNAPQDVQAAIYTEYTNHLGLGDKRAKEAARLLGKGLNVKADGTTVRYGNTFEPVLGQNLDDTMKILSKSYRSGDQYKTGYSRALSTLVGQSNDSTGKVISSLKQIPGVQVSIVAGGIQFELNGRVSRINRPELEGEVRGYNQWKRQSDTDRTRGSKQD